MIGSMSNRAKFQILTATPKNNFTATGDPTTSDDIRKGYQPGSRWVNTASGNNWVCIFNSTGSAKWSHQPRILYQSGNPITAPLDTNENTLATISVPAGCMGLNGKIEMVASFGCTNNGNTKTVRFRFGSVTGASLVTPNISGGASYRVFVDIQNANNASVQNGYNSVGFGSTSNTISPYTVDTTVPIIIPVTITKATGSDSVILYSLSAKLTLPQVG